MTSDPRAHRAYREQRKRWLKRHGPIGRCALCNGAVNMGLSGNDLDGPTIDHIKPLAAGGALADPRNWALAHRRCNTSKGARRPTIAPTIAPRRRDPCSWSDRPHRFRDKIRDRCCLDCGHPVSPNHFDRWLDEQPRSIDGFA